VANNRLDRPNEQLGGFAIVFSGPVRALATNREKGIADSLGFDRIPSQSPSAVSFEELTTILRPAAIETTPCIRPFDQVHLGQGVWHGDARCAAVLIDTGLPDETLDVISVRERPLQRLQYHCRKAFTSGIPVGVCIPHTRASRRGQHMQL